MKYNVSDQNRHAFEHRRRDRGARREDIAGKVSEQVARLDVVTQPGDQVKAAIQFSDAPVVL